MSQESRRNPRIAVPAMYSAVSARAASGAYLDGFVYDISSGGMRFELDDAVDSDTPLDCTITLPPVKMQPTGDPRRPVTFQATGRVVRIHDDEAGPVRMGLQFDDFKTDNDRQTLETYLAAAE